MMMLHQSLPKCGRLLVLNCNTNGSVTAALLYSYDADGSLVSVNYNGTEYYYLRNGQNDVVGLVDGSGNTVVEYSYDAWGKLLSTTGSLASTLGVDNPIRYRGYYYDTETGLYYLQSRYYDPETCRFINADDVAFLGATGTVLSGNLFAYCENNPVTMIDYDGHAAANIIGGIIGGVIGALLGYIIADALGLKGWKRWALIGAVTIAGAVLGVVLGPYISKASKHAISIINSGIKKASSAALRAAKHVKDFIVSSKHLANAGGRYAKFATTSQDQVRLWISQALKAQNAVFYPNGSNSYYIIVDMGKVIGTKGERLLKIVFDAAGKIWTAYPTK